MTMQKLAFHWKSLTEKKLADLVTSIDGIPEADILAKMEVSEKDGAKVYKRKSETVEVNLPDWIDTIPSAAAKASVTDMVANYIRACFLDLFQPAPASVDWENLEKEMASTGGGRRKLDFSEELLASVAASFGAYLAQATGKPAIGERAKEAVAAKLSIASIQKHLNASDEDTMRRLKARLVNWATWIAQQDAEKAEEYAPVFEYLTARLDKNILKLTETPESFKDVL